MDEASFLSSECLCMTFCNTLLISKMLIVIIWAMVLLMVCSSLTIAVVLLTTHMLEDSYFPEPDENGLMPYSWSKHQMLTTSD